MKNQDVKKIYNLISLFILVILALGCLLIISVNFDTVIMVMKWFGLYQ